MRHLVGRCFKRACAAGVVALCSTLHAATGARAEPGSEGMAGGPAGAANARATSGEVVLSFVGDIMLDSRPGAAVAKGVDAFAGVGAELLAADLAIGNLECPVARGGAAVSKRWTFRADPRVLPLLGRYFGAVSLANNHSGDYGKGALVETMQHLAAHSLPFFGAGVDLEGAHRPLFVTRRGVRIALLGYNEFLPRAFEAGPSTPGVAWSEDEQVVHDIRQARAAGADLVIPFMHWGFEHEREASRRQRELAHAMIEAGADAVIGAHPHVTQPIEIFRGKVIAYSLGNFVFDGFSEAEARVGWMLTLRLGRSGVSRWHTRVVRLDEDGLPRLDARAASPCGDALRQALCPHDGVR